MEKKRTDLKSLLFLIFIIMVTGTTFGQVSDLVLYPSDIRFEPVYSNNTLIGYNLFVRKKPGMESVMLTEPSGYHALRSMEWNPINGFERREISGVPLSGEYSRYSILSSTPIYDTLFFFFFQLFIPLWVVYGNPSSSAGTAFLPISNGVQINIRTFGHKYADPNMGRFQNNLTLINIPVNYYPSDYRAAPVPASAPEIVSLAQPPTVPVNYDELRRQLNGIILNKAFLAQMENTELEKFLRHVFLEKAREQRNN
jgi:hypothetical protein